MAKTVLATYDTGPSRNLGELEGHLKSRGHDVQSFLLNAGKNEAPNEQKLREAVDGAGVVLCGISSTPAIEIAAAARAYTMSVPFGFYAETFDRWQASHLQDTLADATFLLVVNEEEKRRARTLYPGLRVESVGNPEWHKYFLPADREASRALVGAKESECVVIVPFTKNKDVNMGKVAVLLQAISKPLTVGESYRYSGPVRMVINIHPGDQTPRSFYDDRLSGLPRAGVLQAVFSDKSADELIPGADLVIGPSTSAAIHAMARHIPLVDIRTEAIRAWLKAETGEEHTYFSRHSGSMEFSDKDFEGLTGLLVYLTERFRDPIIVARWEALMTDQSAAQGKLIPHSVKGASIERIADVLISIQAPVLA